MADDGGEVVRFEDLACAVDARHDLRGVDDVDLEAALLDDVQMTPVGGRA